MLLVNALYFKGKWAHLFHESNTFSEPFFMDNGQTVNTPMMHHKVSIKLYAKHFTKYIYNLSI